jgi:hypothetical protein
LKFTIPCPVHVAEVSPPLNEPPCTDTLMFNGPSLNPSSRTSTRICTLNWCPAAWFAGGRTWNASA